MLDLFKSKATEVGTPARRTLSDERKKLRWLCDNPPPDDCKRMVITSDMAEAMMERNKDDDWHNRPHSEKGLRRYIKSMEKGWRLTGETIIFSKSGRLLNGQHRLMASIKSGLSFPCHVIFNIDDDAFPFMDTGIARQAGHIFAIDDIPNYNAVAAAARVLYGYENVTDWAGRDAEIENSDLLEFYYANERLQDSFKFAKVCGGELKVAGRWAIFGHYICAQKNRSQANAYFEAIGSGANLGVRSVEFKVRKRLLQDAMSTSERLSQPHIAAFVIKGWNAIREGRELQNLKWRTEQSPNENFPRAK